MSEGATSERRPAAPAVSVVVVTYQSEAVVEACLASLPAALAGVGPHEVIVVDNASSDGTLGLVEAIAPEARVVRMSENLGYAAAFNAAVAVAEPTSALLLINPDVRLGHGSVQRLLWALGEPGTGISVPRLLGPEGALEPSLRREPTVLRALGEAVLGGGRAGRFQALGELVSDPEEYRVPRAADWATGAVMLISRQCIAAVGDPGPGGTGAPWDESFFLYSEETEFALRARDHGFSLRYVPEAVAVHLGGESGTSPELWSLLTRNRVRLHRRRHGILRGAAFWLAVCLNEALRCHRGPTHRAALRSLVRPGTAGRRQPSPAEPAGYVCFSAQDWWYHNQAHSDFQLMRRVAADRTVLLVNSIGMRMPLPGRSTQFLRRILRKAASITKLVKRPVADLPRFWVMTPVIVPLYGLPVARRLNAWLVRTQVTLAARRLGITNPVVVVTIPTAWEVVRRMEHRFLVYNRSDKHSAFGEVNQPYIESLEAELLRHCDSVLYVSHALMEQEAPVSGERAFFLDHGVDLEHFRVRPQSELPEDLRSIPRPRAGFFGGLDDYTVDFDLLEHLARELPDVHVVLIGDATCSMGRFEELPNVHWLGFRPYSDIPRYGSGFDVALMPWLANEWIAHSNPIKLKEYLALGLAVVSTDYPELRPYRGLVSAADDHDGFVRLVREALRDGGPSTPEGRRAAVAQCSWDRQAARLMELCETPGRDR